MKYKHLEQIAATSSTVIHEQMEHTGQTCLKEFLKAFYNLGAPLVQLVECQTLDRKVTGSYLTRGTWCCVLEQDISSSLLSTGSTQENIPT